MAYRLHIECVGKDRWDAENRWHWTERYRFNSLPDTFNRIKQVSESAINHRVMELWDKWYNVEGMKVIFKEAYRSAEKDGRFYLLITYTVEEIN